MKNIHVLPTDKPSRVFITNAKSIADNLEVKINIYITSDEEIKEGDWFIEPINKSVLKLKDNADKLINSIFPTCKKIILTTDQDLIKDGVQAIDDEFLEWFVKNPNCEEVEVETYFKKIGVETDANGWREMDVLGKDYRLIIPKEELIPPTKTTEDIKSIVEPKQKNPKDSAVEWLYKNLKSHFEHDGDLLKNVRFSFEIAKDMDSQQRMYSEEELLAFGKRCFYKGFEKAEKDDANCYTAFREEFKDLIEQFKKK